MRIAIFADNFYPELSGVADSVWLSGKALAERGHQVTFFVPRYGQQEFALARAQHKELAHHPNVKIQRITSFGYPTATKQGRGTIPNIFRGFFHRGSFDIVHTHSFLSLGIEAYCFSKINRIPLVGTNHTVIESFLEFAPPFVRKYLPKYLIWYYGKCSHVTVPSVDILSKMQGEGLRGSGTVISNPVQNDFYVSRKEKDEALAADPERVFTFLYVGRISREKNVIALVDGFEKFLAEHREVNARLRLVGGGAQRDALQAEILARGLGAYITIEGPYIGEEKEELYTIFRSADVFVTASLSEVQPMTILQAMAARMPCIVAESWSLPALVLPDRGLVFDASDPAALAANMYALYENRELCKEMGDNAAAHVHHYGVQHIATHWEDFYRDMINKHHGEQKLSVIISAHNEEKYIAETLEHILADAPHALHEIIVVDNASTDRTAQVAASFPGVRVVSELEKGLTKARQRGYREATGEIQAYLDADGHMPRGWVYCVLREFREDPSLVCLSGPAHYHDVTILKKMLVRLYWYVSYLTYLGVGYMAQGGNFILTKKALDEVGGFDTSIAFYGEDTNIARRASEIGKVKFTLWLPMYTSGRRFRGQGFVKTAILYIKNFFSEVLLKKPVTDDYIDVR